MQYSRLHRVKAGLRDGHKWRVTGYGDDLARFIDERMIVTR